MAAAKPSPMPDRIPVADTVRAIVARTCRRSTVSAAIDFARDLHLDSADMVELLMAIELAFHFDFQESETASIVTVGDLIAAVETKIGAGGAVAGEREKLLDAIKDLAAGATATGEAIDIGAAAQVFVEDFAGAGLSFDEICRAVADAAGTAGATVVPGSGRRRA